MCFGSIYLYPSVLKVNHGGGYWFQQKTPTSSSPLLSRSRYAWLLLVCGGTVVDEEEDGEKESREGYLWLL